MSALLSPSAALSSWIHPQFLSSDALREAALTQRRVRYVVADNFFRANKLKEFEAAMQDAALQEDDVGSNYHSTALRVDRESDVPFIRFLMSSEWHNFASHVLDSTLRLPGESTIKWRRHPHEARGFWIHTDQDSEKPKALAILCYLNKRWQTRDGGLLQIWDHAAPSSNPHSRRSFLWADYLEQRLDFLETEKTVEIEVAATSGGQVARMELLDQIVPTYNRVVFMDFQYSSAFHAVTPSHGKLRKGFLQWLF